MHLDDLRILVIGHGRGEVDGLLWDPMPGGSKLLDQFCRRFEKIAAATRKLDRRAGAVAGLALVLVGCLLVA
jgi:hypothetical protein